MRLITSQCFLLFPERYSVFCQAYTYLGNHFKTILLQFLSENPGWIKTLSANQIPTRDTNTAPVQQFNIY